MTQAILADYGAANAVALPVTIGVEETTYENVASNNNAQFPYILGSHRWTLSIRLPPTYLARADGIIAHILGHRVGERFTIEMPRVPSVPDYTNELKVATAVTSYTDTIRLRTALASPVAPYPFKLGRSSFIQIGTKVYMVRADIPAFRGIQSVKIRPEIASASVDAPVTLIKPMIRVFYRDQPSITVGESALVDKTIRLREV